MHQWLRYGTPKESYSLQLLRLIIAVVLLLISGVGIILIIKMVKELL